MISFLSASISSIKLQLSCQVALLRPCSSMLLASIAKCWSLPLFDPGLFPFPGWEPKLGAYHAMWVPSSLSKVWLVVNAGMRYWSLFKVAVSTDRIRMESDMGNKLELGIKSCSANPAWICLIQSRADFAPETECKSAEPLNIQSGRQRAKKQKRWQIRCDLQTNVSGDKTPQR